MNAPNLRTRSAVTAALVLIGTTAALYLGAGCRTDFGTGGGTDSNLGSSGRTLGNFTAIQVDPRSEDSAGPQFVSAEDIDGDGLMDLVSAWNHSQPVQVHLQQRSASGTVSFETVTLAGSIPAVAVAGLAVADFDDDGHPDIAVLVKESLLDGAGCLGSEVPGEGLRGEIVLYLAPTDPAQANEALAWIEAPVGQSFLQGEGDDFSDPEVGGYTGMTVGDINVDGNPDIVVAWNSGCDGGRSDALVFLNNGPGPVRDGSWTAVPIPDSAPKGGAIKDVALGDIDRDGDLDIVATFPEAQAMNVRWYRNPTLDLPDDFHLTGPDWQVGTVGQISSGADKIRMADVDRDGLVDVVVRSSAGNLIQAFRGPPGATTAPLRNIPWQVYTLAEFTDRTPAAFALGDIDGDGQNDLVASATGALAWFDAGAAQTVYDPWVENLILDEQAATTSTSATATVPGTAPAATAAGTVINSVLAADIDGDGDTDIVVTLDRTDRSGLTNDALAWFRNNRG